MPEKLDRYARYTRLKFDRPHPRVLRITLASPLKMGAMDAQMHREASEIWADVDADDSVSVGDHHRRRQDLLRRRRPEP